MSHRTPMLKKRGEGAWRKTWQFEQMGRDDVLVHGIYTAYSDTLLAMLTPW